MEYYNCKWCGSRIDADARRCDNCGKEVAPAKPSFISPPTTQPTSKPTTPQAPQRLAKSQSAVPQMAAARNIRRLIFLGVFLYVGYRAYQVMDIFAPGIASLIHKTDSTNTKVTPEESSKGGFADQLNSTNADTRYNACQAIGSMTNPQADLAPVIIKHLKDPADNVRGSCAWAISKYGASAANAIPVLISLLNDSSAYPRMTAAESLGEISSKIPDEARAVPFLAKALEDPDDQVRRFAAVGLKAMGDRVKPAIPALLIAIHDSSDDVRENSMAALAPLASADPQIVPAFIQALKDKNNNVKLPAIEALGNAGPAARPALPALGKLLDDDMAGGVAAEAIGKCCQEFPETVSYLILAVNNPNHDVRKFGVMYLGQMGPRAKAAVPALIPVLSGEEIYLRVWAAEALGNIGPDAKAALPRLQEMLNEKLDSKEMEAAELPGTVKTAIQKINVDSI